MNVELYERIWMWAATALLAAFLAAIFLVAGLEAVHPPSHVETVDPAKLASHPEFGNPRATTFLDGTVHVSIVAQTFSFSPDPIEIPANRPVTFRLTSADVIHGFQIVGTNANAMVIPGYVTEFTFTFAKPGEYLIACNEYCGLAHHNMIGKVIVKREAS